MRSALVTYYTFTGEASRITDVVAKELGGKGFEVTVARVDFADPSLRLQRPLPVSAVKRWTAAAESGERLPIVVAPPSALSRPYDLICIVSNTWQHLPAVPVRSLLALPAMQALLKGTPFAVYVVCRRSWTKNLEIVRHEAERCGGRFVAGERFEHRGGNLASLVRTVSYLMSSGDRVARWLGMRLPLPEYGVGDEVLARAAEFTRSMIAKASPA